MIFIILPVYNEEKNIIRVIASIRSILKNRQCTVVAVDDGSKDASLRKLRTIKTKGLIIEHYLCNMNVGTVFQTGISRVLSMASDSDTAIIMESDGTSSVERIPVLVDGIDKGKNDIVIASRYVKGGSYKNFPFMRMIFSASANAILKHYFPIPHVSDYTIFFRAYRVRLLRKAVQHFGLFGLIQSLGFTANAELLVKLSFFTERISEIPFLYDYGKKKGKSKIGVVRTITEYISTITYLKQIQKKIITVNGKGVKGKSSRI